MGSLGSPKLWVPYINSKDCSLGFCSLYCPQWCYVIYPPPPPLDFSGDDDGGSTFSPLIIAGVIILTAAFLLVSYFTLVSKYCRNNNNHNDDDQRTATTRTRFSRENPFHDDDVAWHVATSSTEGLDEALIQKIPVIKYKKGNGIVEGTAMTEHCSVCLGEFREDERLRALPKCSHAFHVECIDTWLRSHSNCPLCRSNVEIGALSADVDQSGSRGESVVSDNASGENDVSTTRVLNDLEENHSTQIEVRDSMRRSVSMDFTQRDTVYVVDILMSREEEEQEEGFDGKANCSKSNGSDRSNYNKNVNRLHVRSVSSGRFFLTRSIIGAGKGKMSSNSVIPL